MASFNIISGTFTTRIFLIGPQTGRVAAGAAINVTGNNAVDFTGGAFDGSFASPTIANDGTIQSNFIAIFIPAGTGTIYIRNTGSIVADREAISYTSPLGTMIVDNAGSLVSNSATTVAFDDRDDMFVIRNGSSTSGIVDGGLGTDWLNYAAWTGSGVSVALGSAATGMAGNIRFENVYGSGQGDNITGEAGANVLVGLDGNDSLTGLAGNDTLWGGTGNDTLLGGADSDLFYGGAGDDSMAGGSGDDIYQVTDSGDVVTENASEGTDIVFATTSWAATSLNIETVYAVGSGLTLSGSSGPDTLVADATAGSTLRGGAGQDTLWGQAGADSLSGGSSSDTLRGGDGNDTLSGDAGNDQLVGGTGADIFVFGTTSWGYDQIFDFSRAEGDKIDMRGSGITSLAGFAAVQEADGNSQLIANGGSTVDLYGFTGLVAGDFIFS